MEHMDTASILNRFGLLFNREITGLLVDEWHDQCEHFTATEAHAAASQLAGSSQWFPTLAAFIAAYEAERAAEWANERELGAPTRCVGCFDGPQKGWREVAAPEGSSMTVERCHVCNPAKPKAEHPRDCSCMECHYGHERAGSIRRGVDGMTAVARSADDIARMKVNVDRTRETLRGLKRKPIDAKWKSRETTSRG